MWPSPLGGGDDNMNGPGVTTLVRGWVELYTRGLPADVRAARRDEVDDDLVPTL